MNIPNGEQTPLEFDRNQSNRAKILPAIRPTASTPIESCSTAPTYYSHLNFSINLDQKVDGQQRNTHVSLKIKDPCSPERQWSPG